MKHIIGSVGAADINSVALQLKEVKAFGLNQNINILFFCQHSICNKDSHIYNKSRTQNFNNKPKRAIANAIPVYLVVFYLITSG